ncbi:MAG: hypothetical protein FH754_12870 [Marinobacter sp.]|nr:hypothetical protein [Marinobacter sp.]
MSTRELITEHLDLWTLAVTKKASSGRGSNGKVELTGAQKLRELILELAIRGNLVSQNPDHEPAVIHLQNAANEQVRLVKSGVLKKAKKPKPIAGTDGLFKLPSGWAFCRLADIGHISNGNSISQIDKEAKYAKLEGGVPYIATKDVGYGFTSLHYDNGVRTPRDENFKIASPGSILICSEGGSAGKKCGITNQDISFGNKLYALQPFAETCSQFILSFYLTQTFRRQFEERMTGIIGGISLSKFESIIIPVPPLEEQRLIVQKVDELMALCDRLEQQTSDQLEAHEVLVDTLLGTLTQSDNTTELEDNWARLAAYFDTLFTTEQSIDKLKQAILQLAVMGRLVEHYHENETSPDATETNTPTRFHSNTQNKKKNRGSALPIDITEKPFAVPESWRWERVNNLIESNRDISYGIIKLGKEPQAGGVHTLRCSDVKPRYIDSSTVRRVSEEIESSYQRTRLEGGEVLLNIRGTLGGVALVPYELRGFNIAREVAMLPFGSSVFGPYMVNLIASPFFWKMIESNLKGIAYKGLNLSTLRSLAIPIPPIDEQKSIVQKTDELLGLCDQLKERLSQANETRYQMAEAVVEVSLN